MLLDDTNWSGRTGQDENPAGGFNGPASFQATWPRMVDEPGHPAARSEAPQHSDPATDLLIRARALVARRWCRNAHAHNRLGFAVSPFSRYAVAWCMSGALDAAAIVTSDLDRRHAVCRLRAAIGGVSIVDFNDTQVTVEPVLAAFDRAIAAGPEDGP